MELSIKPYPANRYPIGAILIKSSAVSIWVKEIQGLGISLSEIMAYPVPDLTANSLWGCLLVGEVIRKINDPGRNSYCQLIKSKLFIPEHTILFPAVTDEEIDQLFGDRLHLFHPSFGLVELEGPIRWEELLTLPKQVGVEITEPSTTVFIPRQINQFLLHEIPPEEVLKDLEENQFPQRKKLSNKPLNILEKIKLGALRWLFHPAKPGDGSPGHPAPILPAIKKTNWLEKIESFFTPRKENKWINKLQAAYENLEERNQKEMDKLLELFRRNPEEALKYAIPLDEAGSVRGGEKGILDLSKRWMDFSLFGNAGTGSRSGGAVLANEHYHRLRNQYMATAQELIKEKEFQKAAFIYMKLLKDHNSAANTLEEGMFFQEAASVHLKYTDNKVKAAECYEKGRMTTQAIELYKELKKDEKVGDLYLTLNNRKDANRYFEKVAEQYKFSNQYVKASLLYKNKIENTSRAQSLLMEGWRADKDAFNCLNNYFSNIQDLNMLEAEIEKIYAADTPENKKETYLRVIKYEFERHPELAETTREIAYQIIAERAAKNPSIVSELQSFNKKDMNLLKDIIKYKHARKGE